MVLDARGRSQKVGPEKCPQKFDGMLHQEPDCGGFKLRVKERNSDNISRNLALNVRK